MEDKTFDKLCDIEDRVLLVLFIIIFLLGLYSVYDSQYLYSKASGKSLLALKPHSETSESVSKEIPDDMAAWLTLDDTGIDYPIMQGTDNFEYLNKDPFGKYSLAGSIFLDAGNSRDFTDQYNLVYGHHMEEGHMFGALDQYLDKEFFLSHRTGTLTIGSTVYSIQIFAVLSLNNTDREIFDIGYDGNRMEYIRENALYMEEPGAGRVIALSTCSSESLTSRRIVLGTLKRSAP